MEKNHRNPPGNFCPMVPIMNGIDSYSTRCEYHLTIKKPRMHAFLRSPDLRFSCPTICRTFMVNKHYCVAKDVLDTSGFKITTPMVLELDALPMH